MIDRALIGTVFPVVTVEVSPSRIALFARSIGDDNPIYHDEAAARRAGYRGIPVPPTYPFALQMDRPDPWELIRILNVKLENMLHAEQRFVYRAPIVAGDRVALTEQVAEIYEKKNGALVFCRCHAEGRLADGTLAVELDRTLVVRRDP
ncbi:MAG: MaoC family dehydratase N-terminal domain-containing protein [Gemmatimonadota bacterium]